MDYASPRNDGCRIFEFAHRGNKMVSLENNLLKVTVMVDKGSDIVEFVYKPGDVDFMWKAPGGIRDLSKIVSSKGHTLGNYLDYYEGGWQDIMPGGGPRDNDSAELGLHGETPLLPWQFSVAEDEFHRASIRLTCRTNRYPLYIEKKLSLEADSSVLRIEESVTNESEEKLPFMWGHHPAIGKPFLDESCRIDVPATKFVASGTGYSPTSYFDANATGEWPIHKATDGMKRDMRLISSFPKPTADLFYLMGLSEGWYAITNMKQKLGIGFAWDVEVFPYVWYWQVFNGLSGYPWYGRTYNIALEPWTSYPANLNEAISNGSARYIEGNATLRTELHVVVYRGLEKVERITRSGVVY